MPHESIVIYSARVDPEGVRRWLLKKHPTAKVIGSGAHWREITVTLGRGRTARTLTFRHDADYYEGLGWQNQKSGMKGYFAQFPGVGRLPIVFGVIDTLNFALATEFSPDFDPEHDDRFKVLYGVARFLDGILFTPTSLRDADGQILVSKSGRFDDDVTWPKGTPTVPIAVDSVDGDDDAEPTPPSAERVARRALALAAVTGRAVIERDHEPKAGSAIKQKRLLDWMATAQIADELEPDERKAVHAKPGKLGPQRTVNGIWRIEALAVLLWALRKYELPRYDTLVNIDQVWDAVGFLLDPKKSRFIIAAKLRSKAELETFRKQMLGYHWRLRDYQHVKPEPMDFRAFSKKCWFGSFDIRPFKLIDKDLALQGERIDQAGPDVFQNSCSIALERHQAINWLCFGPDALSEADTST